MAFTLLEDRVAVLADEVSEMNEAGLYVPESGGEVIRYGTVHSVGVGRISEHGERIYPDVEVGDRVFFNRYSGSPITVDGTEYLFLATREIIGVIIENDEDLYDEDLDDEN